MKVEDIQL